MFALLASVESVLVSDPVTDVSPACCSLVFYFFLDLFLFFLCFLFHNLLDNNQFHLLVYHHEFCGPVLLHSRTDYRIHSHHLLQRFCVCSHHCYLIRHPICLHFWLNHRLYGTCVCHSEMRYLRDPSFLHYLKCPLHHSVRFLCVVLDHCLCCSP